MKKLDPTMAQQVAQAVNLLREMLLNNLKKRESLS